MFKIMIVNQIYICFVCLSEYMYIYNKRQVICLFCPNVSHSENVSHVPIPMNYHCLPVHQLSSLSDQAVPPCPTVTP